MTEAERQERFPICREQIYFAHAGVTALPQAVAQVMSDYILQSAQKAQEFGDVLRDVREAREVCAEFIGATADEIALLGPTSLGLSLFANGIAWQPGDEIVCYGADYPANIYPWVEQERRGVVIKKLRPEQAGEITPELVQAALTPRTRLVALASCHFFTGYRIDVDAIGRMLHERGVLLSIDGIQSLGAFPLSVEHVDFLSADAHKWMLGPLAIGIVYVKKAHFGLVRPTLLGAWNVVSPNFIAQEEIEIVPTAQRYEPGVLNVAGIYGMVAAIRLLQAEGMERVGARLLGLKAHLLRQLDDLGFTTLGPREGATASGITTFRHPMADAKVLYRALETNGVVASLRHTGSGEEYIRFSPHFYNTEAEIDRAVGVLRGAL